VSIRHVAATALLIAGCSLQVLAVLGLLAMRDTLDRLHYVGLAGYGALCVGVAVLVRQSFSLIGDKALFAGAMLALIGPVLAHVTARSLLIRRYGDWRRGAEGEAGEQR
jgi:multisubunit Na+/H+ antiporter MnhG subunit